MTNEYSYATEHARRIHSLGTALHSYLCRMDCTSKAPKHPNTRTPSDVSMGGGWLQCVCDASRALTVAPPANYEIIIRVGSSEGVEV